MVLAIVALLLTIAAPRFVGSVEAARETVLVENLAAVRRTIDAFHADTGRYPKDLAELVTRKYLHAAPVDPYTESAATWQLVAPEDGVGVADIRSGAAGSTRDGRPLQEL